LANEGWRLAMDTTESPGSREKANSQNFRHVGSYVEAHPVQLETEDVQKPKCPLNGLAGVGLRAIHKRDVTHHLHTWKESSSKHCGFYLWTPLTEMRAAKVRGGSQACSQESSIT